MYSHYVIPRHLLENPRSIPTHQFLEGILDMGDGENEGSFSPLKHQDSMQDVEGRKKLSGELT